jgi:magnesium chelatase subunit ChlI-like protein
LHACPCGCYGDTTRECRCTGAIIQRYLGKISGPLLDRIDLHIEVPAVAYKGLRGRGDGVTSEQMRAQVLAARKIQHRRGFYNAHIPDKQRRVCGRPNSYGREWTGRAMIDQPLPPPPTGRVSGQEWRRSTRGDLFSPLFPSPPAISREALRIRSAAIRPRAVVILLTPFKRWHRRT